MSSAFLLGVLEEGTGGVADAPEEEDDAILKLRLEREWDGRRDRRAFNSDFELSSGQEQKEMETNLLMPWLFVPLFVVCL